MLPLKAKRAEGRPPGTMLYSMSLYDSNDAITHRRAVEFSLEEIERLQLKDFIPDSRDEVLYYGPDAEYPSNGPLTDAHRRASGCVRNTLH